MPLRIASSMALIAFALCLVMGMTAENPFGTVVLRALAAMAGTMVVGAIIGTMGRKMIEENVEAEKKKAEIHESKGGPSDR